MDVNMLTQLIGTLGFPIVCCAYLFWENHNQREMHAEKEEKLTDAINKLTSAIDVLIEKEEHRNAS